MVGTMREDAKHAIHDLSTLLNEAVEQVPAGQVGFFNEFVRRLASTIAALESYWRVSPGEMDLDTRSSLLVLSRLMGSLLNPPGEFHSTDPLQPSIRSPITSAVRARDTIPIAHQVPTVRQILPSTDRRAPSADEIAEANRRWDAALARGHRHRDAAIAQVGPVLTPAEAGRRLGVSPVTVKNWRQRGKLLGIKFDDHQYVYPLFQFAASPDEGESGIVRHFGDILRALPYRSSWAKAQFFVVPLPSLGGQTPIEVLRAVGSAEARHGGPETSAERIDRLRQVAEHAGEMGA
jgi:hypothetical protein